MHKGLSGSVTAIVPAAANLGDIRTPGSDVRPKEVRDMHDMESNKSKSSEGLIHICEHS